MQLMELGIPMVLALNMMDEVRANGGSVRVNELERLTYLNIWFLYWKRKQGLTGRLHLQI